MHSTINTVYCAWHTAGAAQVDGIYEKLGTWVKYVKAGDVLTEPVHGR